MTAANRSSDAVVIGNAVVDEIRLRGSSIPMAGGAGLNLAAHLTHQGVSAALIASIGNDDDGLLLREAMVRHGVRLIDQPHLPATARVISHRTTAEPRYEFDSALQGRRVAFTPAVDAEIRATRAVVCANFRFDVTEQADDLAAAISRSPGLRAIDPNPRPRLIPDAGRFRTQLERVAALAHLVKVSTEDLEFLYGTNRRTGAQRLLEQGPAAVMVTRGADGAEIVTSAGDTYYAPVADLPTSVIDTMGAGDAALAVLLTGAMRQVSGMSANAISQTLRSLDWQELLEQSMLHAALACRTLGGLPHAER
jgi:fructokinase